MKTAGVLALIVGLCLTGAAAYLGFIIARQDQSWFSGYVFSMLSGSVGLQVVVIGIIVIAWANRNSN